MPHTTEEEDNNDDSSKNNITRRYNNACTLTAYDVMQIQQTNYQKVLNDFNPLKCSGVRQLHFKVFNAIQV